MSTPSSGHRRLAMQLAPLPVAIVDRALGPLHAPVAMRTALHEEAWLQGGGCWVVLAREKDGKRSKNWWKDVKTGGTNPDVQWNILADVPKVSWWKASV